MFVANKEKIRNIDNRIILFRGGKNNLRGTSNEHISQFINLIFRGIMKFKYILIFNLLIIGLNSFAVDDTTRKTLKKDGVSFIKSLKEFAGDPTPMGAAKLVAGALFSAWLGKRSSDFVEYWDGDEERKKQEEAARKKDVEESKKKINELNEKVDRLTQHILKQG